MDYLYIVVLSLSLIMLIVFLIVFGAMLYTKQEVNPFPPVPNTCPDFWPEINGSCLYLPEGSDAVDAVDAYETYLKDATDSDNNKIYSALLDNNNNLTSDNKEKLAFIKDTKMFSSGGKNNGSLGDFMTLLESQDSDRIDSSHYVWELDTDNLGIRFNENATLCDKRKWANNYGIKWDGVSNYNHC